MNMLQSSSESGNLDNHESNGQFLRDIEEISKALIVESKPMRNCTSLSRKSVKKSHFRDWKSKSKLGVDDNDELCREECRTSSIWDWKPLKALSHIRHRKFVCYFFCHVHCIDNLDSSFDGISMSVCWKRKDNVWRTCSSRVVNGMVDFEETLMSKCTVYGAKSGPGKLVKYDPKIFLLCVSVVGGEGIDVGKHWVDLTRLLPLTFDDLEKDKCPGKWSTSFKLGGKADNASLHVSFGYLVTKDALAELGSNIKLPLCLNLEQSGNSRMSFVAGSDSGQGNANLRRVGSVPSSLTNSSSDSNHDVKLGRVTNVSEFSDSIYMLYGKLDEEGFFDEVDEGGFEEPRKSDLVFEHLESLNLTANTLSASAEDYCLSEHDDDTLIVIESKEESESATEEKIKMTISTTEDLDLSTVEVIDVAEIFKGEEISSNEEIKPDKVDAPDFARNDLLIDEYNIHNIDELKPELAATDIHGMLFSESAELDDSAGTTFDELKSKRKGARLIKSLSLDDVAKAVAEDFCMLLLENSTASTPSSNSRLESPRECLLRQFEEEMMTSGAFFLGVDEQEDDSESDYAALSISSSDSTVESVDLSPVTEKARNQSMYHSSRSKLQAKSLERLESQSLMQRWGLDEEAFLSSPHYSNGGFGSPIFCPSESNEPIVLPPLGEGLDSLFHMKDGGLLRSMSPSLFQNAKNCGSLIMQASKLVVVPAELSFDIMEIFQGLAAVGSERLSSKLRILMPLEELSGNIMQQLAWEALYEAEELKRSSSAQHENEFMHGVQGSADVQHHNYSSFPTVSDVMADYVSAKDLSSLALDSVEALTIDGLKVQSGMSDQDASSSIRVKSLAEAMLPHLSENIRECSDLLGRKGTANYADELLDLFISLDEWLRLDSGMFGDENHFSDRTLKLLRAHRAKSVGEDYTCNEYGKTGLFGDSLTVALMIQLRDPLRNYEPVGAPMLGFFQAERVLRPANFSSEACSSGLEIELDLPTDPQKVVTQRVPGLRLTEANVAGLNLEPDLNESWASKRQQESGSRWLLASGLTNKRDCHFSKSRSLVRLSNQVLRKPKTRNILWSISQPIQGVQANAGFSTVNRLTRNPDIIFQ